MKSRLAELIGWYGTTAILAAYSLVSFKLLQPNLVYQLLNATGAAAIVFISYRKKAYEPASLNAVWMVIALVALVRML